MPLNQVRKVARTGTMFHIELGRSSTVGEGALFMTADETSALNMHEIIRNAMATKVVQRSSISGHPPMVDGHGHRSESHRSDGHRLSESHRHRTDSYGNRPDGHSHTSSPASSPPILTILNPRHDSISCPTSRDSKSSRNDSKTLTSSTGEDIYVEMGPGSNSGNFGSNSGNFGSNAGNFGSNAGNFGSNAGNFGSNSGNVSTPSSCTEEQGYLEMNMDATVSKAGTSSISSSLDQDPEYLDMSPVSSSLSGIGANHGHYTGHPGSRARTGTTGSVRSSGERRSRSGRGIYDVDPPELPPTSHGTSDDTEFPLEKVRSFLEESGESDSVLLAPVRAYSIGSRPTTTRLLARHGGHGHATSIGSSSSVGPSSSSTHQRVRSNTVGSRPPAFSPPSLSAASSTSSHLLSSTSKLTSSSNDQMDHMEIDYTNSSSTSGLAIRKLSQGHRARSDSKSSTSSTASASVPAKVKEEPWEAYLPSTLATHSSPLNTGGQGTVSGHLSATASQSTIQSGGTSQTSSASSSLSQTIVGASFASGSSASAGEKTPLAEGESASASDKCTSAGGKSASADVLPSSATVSSANEQSSSATPQQSAADTEPVSASSATSVAQSSESASSSSSSVTSSAPSSTVPIGPAKPDHSSASGHHSSSKKPSSVTKSNQPGHSLTANPHSSMRAPSLLPSLPESTTGSIGSLSSLKKETSPEIIETGNDDSVTYTVIDFQQQEKQIASSEATNIASSS